MIRELGEEGFKQHKKDNFARGHRLHRFLVWRLLCFFSCARGHYFKWNLLKFKTPKWPYRVVEEFLETGSVPEMDEVKHVYQRICEH